MLGYNKFKNLCVACHTVNLEGGEIGPELNIPQNITEYREIPYLKQFIKNPSSFRARSRMMTFDFLADEDLDSILAYLSYMADHKKLDKINAH
nr:cytochrome c [Aliamphritea spongicola]